MVLAFGCGGDGDSDGDSAATTAAGQPTTTAGGAPNGDECRFVSTSAVQDVFGDAIELIAADQGCSFTDHQLTLQLSYIAVQIDPEQYADEAVVANCDEGTAVEVDAGDRAFACISFVGPLANLYEGRDLVVVNASGVEDEDAQAVRDDLAEPCPR